MSVEWWADHVPLYLALSADGNISFNRYHRQVHVTFKTGVQQYDNR